LARKTAFLTLAATALAGAALLLAACGGDDSTTDATDSTDASADYVTEANAICATASDELAQLAQTTGVDPQGAQLKAFYAGAEQILEKQVTGLTALEAPAGQEEQVDAYNQALEDLLVQFRKDPESVGTPEGNKIRELASAAGLQAECGSANG